MGLNRTKHHGENVWKCAMSCYVRKICFHFEWYQMGVNPQCETMWWLTHGFGAGLFSDNHILIWDMRYIIICTCIYIIYAYMHIHIYAYMHICIYIYINMHIYIYAYIYIHINIWCWSKFLYLGTAILREYKNYFRETFANSMFTFRGAHVGQQHLLWRFVHHLPNYARESRITSW